MLRQIHLFVSCRSLIWFDTIVLEATLVTVDFKCTDGLSLYVLPLIHLILRAHEKAFCLSANDVISWRFLHLLEFFYDLIPLLSDFVSSSKRRLTSL